MSDNVETSFETERGERTGKVARLDVIPLSNGNRRWTPAAKARIIEESFKAGANVAEVAQRHGMLPQQLYNWRGRFRERAEGMGFVPAVIEAPSPSPVPSTSSGPPAPTVSSVPVAERSDGQIVIETRGLSIRIPSDVDADHIERVLLAVQVNT
ncbi:IS66-like element accessory protein TnpA [Sphingobium chlorophenolicum]|uniref:Putative transposase n=1 Tax=Sphingobium chlorophenolicum TaxID=46429 RepID=A0A081R444_SPHCR|nr:transposase [Sphingobium chlorophenolicum]KEQ49967.1 putative transposase [Sphingobium chlorophenolicum]